jgi:acyl-coenzyme A synthetase/AMP-(fatty) acid ligase/thioesterase domain-containing protein/acyl carrier protein
MAEPQGIGASETSSASAGTGPRWIAPDHGGPVADDRAHEDLSDRSIYDVFEDVAARNETAVAVADCEARFTYAQVRNAARQLASEVRVAVPPGTAVAILLRNRARSLIAALACLAADRVSVVLNAEHPAERTRAILHRAAVGAVIIAKDDRAALTFTQSDAIRIPAVFERDHAVERLWPPHAPRHNEPAVVLYTSGSTGEPKGIVLSQAAIHWRLRNGIVHLNREDCYLSLAALDTTSGFIAGVTGLLSGCSQIIVSVSTDGIGSLLSLIRTEHVTILGGVPAMLRTLFELDGSVDAFTHLRVVRTYGERLPWADLAKWRAILPVDCRIAMSYGQTEGYASSWFVPHTRPSAEGAVPVGYLHAEQEYAIVDDAGNSVAPGEVGELIIRSRYVALGEWEDGQCKPGRARLDGTDDVTRLLPTGDLARLDADSLLHIVGRRDRQVKIRGQRVEPTEIEDVLCRVPDVAAAAIVVAREGEETVLFGFVVAHDCGDAHLRSRLHTALQQSLPTYMHPARIFVVDRLPLLPGGKVDSVALLALAAATPRQGGDAEPALTATQRARDAVSRAWLRTLDRTSLEADVPFDEAGGDSLRLLRFIFHLEQQSGITVPLDMFYAALRPSGFAERLDQCLKDLRTIPADARRPLFLLPGVGKDEPRLVRFRAACARDLHIEPIDYGDWPEWLAPGFDLTQIVAQIVAAIEAEAPDGPIFLAGYSLGGEIAYAVAMALSSVGRTIAFLGVLDTNISTDEPTSGRWQRVTAAVRRGESASVIASYLSRWFSHLSGPLRLRLIVRFCRARLPGDLGFYLHWHIRRSVLTHLVKTWWTQIPSPIPQLHVPATLFRSTKHRADASDDLGWREICPNIAVIPVDGDHYTMLETPNLEELSARFTTSILDAVEQQVYRPAKIDRLP